jgi:glucan 1,3-beta-glucosidase
VGFDLAAGGRTEANQDYEAEAIIVAVVTNTPFFVRTSLPSNGALAGSLVLNNIKLINVPTAVGVTGGEIVFSGGTLTIDPWGQGNVYSGIIGQKMFTQGNIPAATKAASLLNSIGNIVSNGHPQYESYAITQFVSARDQGCTGDGHTDDTAAINSLLTKVHTYCMLQIGSLLTFISSTLTIKSFFSTLAHT